MPYYLPTLPPQFRFSLYIVKSIFFYHFMCEYAFERVETIGPSMLPTIAVTSDQVLISRSYRRGRGIVVGDLVSIKHPMFPEQGAIKRVLGMPGDYVLRDTPSAVRSDEERKGGTMIQIPEGHCWLIGDNLDASRDSRLYGPLPLALIKGKVLARVWPWARRGWFENTLKKPEDA